MGIMSRAKVKSRPEWADAVKRLREKMGLSQEGFARAIGLSISEVRRWDQGVRPPGAERAIVLGRMAGPPDCWLFWELAGLSKSDVVRAVEELPGTAVRRRGGRYSQETLEAAYSALGLLFERAPDAVIEQVIHWLTERAGRYGSR